jgi:hypothetical protein
LFILRLDSRQLLLELRLDGFTLLLIRSHLLCDALVPLLHLLDVLGAALQVLRLLCQGILQLLLFRFDLLELPCNLLVVSLQFWNGVLLKVVIRSSQSLQLFSHQTQLALQLSRFRLSIVHQGRLDSQGLVFAP